MKPGQNNPDNWVNKEIHVKALKNNKKKELKEVTQSPGQGFVVVL